MTRQDQTSGESNPTKSSLLAIFALEHAKARTTTIDEELLCVQQVAHDGGRYETLEIEAISLFWGACILKALCTGHGKILRFTFEPWYRIVLYEIMIGQEDGGGGDHLERSAMVFPLPKEPFFV